MNEIGDHWQRLQEALRLDETLLGQWTVVPGEGCRDLVVSSPFHETWIRLRHGALLGPLEALGQVVLRHRRPRRRPGRQPLLGSWNALASQHLKKIVDGTIDSCLILAPAGAGKTLLTRSILGSEQRLWSVRKLCRVVANKKRDGSLRSFVTHLVDTPVLAIDNVHHLYEYPSLASWLPAILDARGGRPLVALGRQGPSWREVPGPIASRLAGGATIGLDYPDTDTRRRLIKQLTLEMRLRLPKDALGALLSRPVTPGRLRHILQCLQQARIEPRQLAGLLRELMRVAHADDLSGLFKHICYHHGIEGAALRSRRRPEGLQRAREEFASMALQAGWRPAEVALMLGRSPRSVQDLARRHGE